MAERKTIVASGYKQVGSRATPEAITKELDAIKEKNEKLKAHSSGPLEKCREKLRELKKQVVNHPCSPSFSPARTLLLLPPAPHCCANHRLMRVVRL